MLYGLLEKRTARLYSNQREKDIRPQDTAFLSRITTASSRSGGRLVDRKEFLFRVWFAATFITIGIFFLGLVVFGILLI
jgi:hypothetical protein